MNVFEHLHASGLHSCHSRVEIRNFFGHFYYEKIPVARELEQFVSSLAAKNDWSWYSSYAYITAYK